MPVRTPTRGADSSFQAENIFCWDHFSGAMHYSAVAPHHPTRSVSVKLTKTQRLKGQGRERSSREYASGQCDRKSFDVITLVPARSPPHVVPSWLQPPSPFRTLASPYSGTRRTNAVYVAAATTTRGTRSGTSRRLLPPAPSEARPPSPFATAPMPLAAAAAD